jgi:hypothetical protein
MQDNGACLAFTGENMTEAEKIIAQVLQKSLERREIPVSPASVAAIAAVIAEALMLAAAEAMNGACLAFAKEPDMVSLSVLTCRTWCHSL